LRPPNATSRGAAAPAPERERPAQYAPAFLPSVLRGADQASAGAILLNDTRSTPPSPSVK
jgi:hypothetical protein